MAESISFARGVPAPECLPEEELADCAREVLGRDGKTILSYGTGAGYQPLREVIAEWHGVPPAQVVITNGGLQGFVLLAQQFITKGVALVESPSYDRPLKILAENHYTIVPLTMDDDGLVPDALQQALREHPDPAFVYLIPTFQNPSGRTIPEERRHEIVKIADRAGATILEDDPYGRVRFEGTAPTSLFELSPENTIYTSSFSKTVAPGLRVGWYVLPENLANAITLRANSTYISPVQLGEAVVFEFIRRGRYEPNLVRVNELLKLRRDAMLGALDKHMSGARWSHPEGGYFIWLELPEGTSAKDVLDRADAVTAVLGTDFGGGENTIRLAYSYVTPEEIDEGISRLAAAVE
jgi:DNA-binding transcriptional MocR family regulator